MIGIQKAAAGERNEAGAGSTGAGLIKHLKKSGFDFVP